MSSERVDRERPDSPDAVRLVAEMQAYHDTLPYPPESKHAWTVDQLLRQGVEFFVMRTGDVPVGCGGVLFVGTEYAEVKRMFVRPEFRGKGWGQRMLTRLAAHAHARGVPLLRLETGIHQPDAVRLYERFGFTRTPPFGPYKPDPNSIFFERRIAGHKQNIHLFAAARDTVGSPTISVELPEGSTVADLRVAAARQFPALAPVLAKCAVAVNQEYVEDSVPISPADELAVVPPVSGG
jgi:molybdopterin converting factor subunit 1